MKNSCHNHAPYDRRSEHPVQDGWTKDGRRVMRPQVTQWAPMQCTHMAPDVDPGCEGCHWIGWGG